MPQTKDSPVDTAIGRAASLVAGGATVLDAVELVSQDFGLADDDRMKVARGLKSWFEGGLAADTEPETHIAFHGYRRMHDSIHGG